MSEAFDTVAQAQARFCEASGAPFTARVLEAVADDVKASGPFAPLLAPWADAEASRIWGDAMWMRILGGLHDISLSGDEPALTEVYPDGGGEPVDAETLSARLRGTARGHGDRLQAFLRSPPQTNEVRRAVALQAGFREVARATGLPLATLEIGASAGLLLNWDAFAYASEDGGWRRGPADAALTLTTDWSGPAPPDPDLRIASRAACDLAPMQVANPEQRRRLAAFVWAEQAERLQRLRAAVDVAVAKHVEVEKADAADWLRERLRPQEGVATVLYHSIMFQYVPPASQAAILETILEASAAASSSAPLAWLRLEPNMRQVQASVELRLSLWPGGGARLLAQAHSHGASVQWLGAA